MVPLRQQIVNASYLARCGLAERDPSGLRNLDERIADAIIAKVPAIAELANKEAA